VLFFEELVSYFNEFDLIFLDTNISDGVIKSIADNAKAPIFADPISCTKSLRLLPAIDKIHTIAPNLMETATMCGIDPGEANEKLYDTAKSKVYFSKAGSSNEHARRDYGDQKLNLSYLDNMADILLEKGLKRLIITLGDNGIYLCDSNKRRHLKAFKADVINTSGCGDAFISGYTSGFVRGTTGTISAVMGLAAAAFTAECPYPIYSELSYEGINERKNNYDGY